MIRTTEDLYYRRVYVDSNGYINRYNNVLYKRTVIWFLGFIPIYVKHTVA